MGNIVMVEEGTCWEQEAGYHLHTGRQKDMGLDYESQGLLSAAQFLQQGSLSERLHNLYKQYS